MPPELWEWEVVMSNDQMGFRKTFRPLARTYNDAVLQATEELSHRYDVEMFIPVSIIRKRSARRA